MSNRFGDSSFSDLLHTPFSQLRNLQPAEKKELSFVVYDLEKSVKPKETLMLDRRIDDESRTMFKTFEATLRQVFMPDMDDPHIAQLQVAKSSYDYSQLVSSLSKILELELNNSVVQKIREMRGIEMPRNYNELVKPDRQEYTVSIPNRNNAGYYIINLNQEKNRKLKPQSLGDISLLIERFSDGLKECLDENDSNKDFRGLTKLIDEMKKHRNSASHTSVLDEKAFKKFYTNFCSLIRENWLTILMDIKETVQK